MWVLLWACTPEPDDTNERHRVTGGDDPATHPGPPTDPPDPPDPTEPGTTPSDRRWDCSGIDPADPAPLGGRVAFSFDDGPDPVDTADALDFLRSEGIPATFMMVGEMLTDPAAWAVMDDIVADPLFDVGNHSWDHSDLADLSSADARAQMDDATAMIETFGVSPAYFRFPYGDSTCATHDMATDRGMNVAGWHIDTADWCYATGGGTCTNDDYWRVPVEYEDDYLGLVMDQVRRFDGGVLLMHDIHAWTVAQLPELVDQLRAEGFTFVAMDDPAAFPNLVAGTPADLPYLGERCDTADDRCWMVEHEAWCEGTGSGTDGICVLPCEGYCLDRDGAATTFCSETAGGEGLCVGRADPRNGECADLPGTVEQVVPRHGYPYGDGTVCVPAGW